MLSTLAEALVVHDGKLMEGSRAAMPCVARIKIVFFVRVVAAICVAWAQV